MDELLMKIKNEVEQKIEAVKEKTKLTIANFEAKIKNNEKDVEEIKASILSCEAEIASCEVQKEEVNKKFITLRDAIKDASGLDFFENESNQVDFAENKKNKICEEKDDTINKFKAIIENFTADIKKKTNENENLKDLVKELEKKIGVAVSDLEKSFKVNLADFNKVNSSFMLMMEQADEVLEQVTKLETNVPDLISNEEKNQAKEVVTAKEEPQVEPILTETGKLQVEIVSEEEPKTEDLFSASSETPAQDNPFLDENGKLKINENNKKEFDVSPFDATVENEEAVEDPNDYLTAGKVENSPTELVEDSFVNIFVGPDAGLTFEPFNDIKSDSMGVASSVANSEYSIDANDTDETKTFRSLSTYLGIDTTGFDDQEKEFIASSMTSEKYSQVVNILNNHGIELSDLDGANSFVEEFVNAEPMQLDAAIRALRSVGKNNEQLDFLLNLDIILKADPELIKQNIARILNEKKDAKDVDIRELASSTNYGEKSQQLEEKGFNAGAIKKGYPITYELSVEELLNNVARTEGTRTEMASSTPQIEQVLTMGGAR